MSTRTPALVVSSAVSPARPADHIGRAGYSYAIVARTFAPLLERWGPTAEVDRPESRLDYALRSARQRNLTPLHLSFAPLHLTYVSARAPNIVFPFWEFPDIPDRSLGTNPRNNWVRIADRLALILTDSTFTRDAFARAGVRTPVQVVPVPIRSEYFSLPAWEHGQQVMLDCPAYVFPQVELSHVPSPSPWVPIARGQGNRWTHAKYVYRNRLRPFLPTPLDRFLTAAVHVAASAGAAADREIGVPCAVSPTLALSGVVYTSIVNPFDPRKAWQDLLSAYLLALSDREDATLVVKLVVPPGQAAAGLNRMVGYYRSLGLGHRCNLAFITAYLSDAQMVELARASTAYVNASRAEGACLPLRDFLAAGRPGISPVHTAMRDYFGDDMGFVVGSHPEPTSWPHDPDRRCTTTWHRLVWQSLHEQFVASYATFTRRPRRARTLAARGRERMLEFAGAECVWPRLAAALDAVAAGGEPVPRTAARGG